MFGMRSWGGGSDEQAATANSEAETNARDKHVDMEVRENMALCRLYGTRTSLIERAGSPYQAAAPATSRCAFRSTECNH